MDRDAESSDAECVVDMPGSAFRVRRGDRPNRPGAASGGCRSGARSDSDSDAVTHTDACAGAAFDGIREDRQP